jgi:hypothetical protein
MPLPSKKTDGIAPKSTYRLGALFGHLGIASHLSLAFVHDFA